MYLIALCQRKPLRPPAAFFPTDLVPVFRSFLFSSLLLLAGLLISGSSVLGQEKISLSVKNAQLGTVFKTIEGQCPYQFWYEDSVLARCKPVTIEVKEASLQQVLSLCFKDQPVTFKIVHHTIVVKGLRAKGSTTSTQLSPPGRIAVTGVVRNEKGETIPRATVMVKDGPTMALTDDKGQFSIADLDPLSTLVITSVGYTPAEIALDGRTSLAVQMKIGAASLGVATVTLSTGYQQIDPHKATGSFVMVDNGLYNRQVAPDIVTKLNGVASGVLITGSGSSLSPAYNVPAVTPNPLNKLGIVIRGQSTLSNQVSKDPLIIIDNVPYEGDINNIDPTMIESVTISKDAAAAAIWGARAGNGVIVFTTKKGRLGQPMRVTFSANTTVTGNQNFDKVTSFMRPSDFMAAEDTLFNRGYFNQYLTASNQPAVSAVVDVLTARAAGTLTPAEAQSRLNALAALDVRKDIKRYIYQRSVNQQYGLNLTGGTARTAYSLSVAYDKNEAALRRNGYERININALNIYTPIKKLEITTGISYLQMNLKSNNNFLWGTGGLATGGVYGTAILPYAQLADGAGHHLAITKDLSSYYKDSVQRLGFKSWQYTPLDELAMADNTTRQYDILLKAGIKYTFTPGLNLEVLYQNEHQTSNNREYDNPDSYYARNLFNQFTQYDPTSGALTNVFPAGGVLALRSSTLNVGNLRAQLNFNRQIAAGHEVTAIGGAEIRKAKTMTYNRTSLGYDDEFGTAVTNLDFSSVYAINPADYAFLPAPAGDVGIYNSRFISYYSSLSYTFDSRYNFTLTGRRDGANIFGVNTNDKFTPLWSAGLRWNTSAEKFYHLTWLPYLTTRLSYGYNGNLYNTSAYLTAVYSTSSVTGAQRGSIISPPNPDLRWERVRNVNVGVDFAAKGDFLSGTLEWFQKNGLDLIEAVPLAPTSGFPSFNGNAASTRTRGIDLTLNSVNVKSGPFTWQTNLLLSTLHDKVLSYDVKQTQLSIQDASVALKGKPIFGVFSYHWAGLDPQTGDPQGYLGKQVSKNYLSIINNYAPDSLVYNGSARPTFYGALRNTFRFKDISLSFNIAYRMGYVFRKPSTSTNYSEVIANPVYDFNQRWQKPGDEKKTAVPSMTYPDDIYRNQFYQYSSVLVYKADNIRLQDVNISYELGPTIFKGQDKSLQVFVYATNLGIIWKANKVNIDPDYINGLIPPRSISIGGRVNF